MKNKTVVLILVALAAVLVALYNVVLVVDTYEEWVAQRWEHNYETNKSYMIQEVSLKPLESNWAWKVHHRKVVLKQRLLTGQTWREYLYDN
jgi:hypothetical protein